MNPHDRAANPASFPGHEAIENPLATLGETLEIEPFQSDGGFDIPRLPIGFGLIAITAVLLGGVIGIIGAVLDFYLLILFPLLMGALIGLFGIGISRRAHIRNLGVAALIMAVGAALTVATVRYVEYRFEVSIWMAETEGQIAELEEGETWLTEDGEPFDPRELYEADLEIARNLGFLEYLQFTAEYGISFGRATESDPDGFAIQGGLVWAYWFLEWLLVFGLAVLIVRNQVNKPYDRNASAWYSETSLGKLPADPERLNAALARGSVEAIRKACADATGMVSMTVFHPAAPDETKTSVIELSKVTDDKGNTTTLGRYTLPSDMTLPLLALMGNPFPAQDEPAVGGAAPSPPAGNDGA